MARTCKIVGCETALKPKNTSGMCPKCYGRENYRTRHGLPGGTIGTIQRKTAAATPKAPKAGAKPEANTLHLFNLGTDGFASLNAAVPVTVAHPCIAVQLPIALLDAWWARLSPEIKAEHFREELAKGYAL
jgi:hypothetical protein